MLKDHLEVYPLQSKMSAFRDVAGHRSTDTLHTFLQYSSLAQQNYSRL